MKTINFFLVLFSFVALFSCDDIEDVDQLKTGLSGDGVPFEPTDPFLYGVNCDDKKVFKFNDLDDMQAEHKMLYDNYIAGGEEEIVLIEYENSKNFYSLRAKDYDMDNGIIPEDPDFDPFNYTSDSILETLLNQDGMVIIGDYIYMWDDGCVIHRKPYNNCSDYITMQNFQSFMFNYSGTPGEQVELMNFRNNDNIEDINICEDYRFDFESISESGMVLDNHHPFPQGEDRGAECGLLSFIEHDVISNDPVEQKIIIKFEENSFSPPGATVIPTFLIDNSSDYGSIKIISASIPGYDGMEWSFLGGDVFQYTGKWFEIEIDYSDLGSIPLLSVKLETVIYPFSSHSCFDNDSLELNIECPLSISKKPINYDFGEYNFVMEGLEDYVGYYEITWNFGDGVVENIVGVNSINHQFPVPCLLASTYNVTASISFGQYPPCSYNPLEAEVITASCVRTTATEKDSDKYEGRKYRLKIKLKQKSGIFGPGSKLKYVFRYRKNGDKEINSFGVMKMATGSGCANVDISSMMPTIIQSGKKRLKQKFNSENFFGIDLDNPFDVNFSHSNGLNKTLSVIEVCPE